MNTENRIYNITNYFLKYTQFLLMNRGQKDIWLNEFGFQKNLSYFLSSISNIKEGGTLIINYILDNSRKKLFKNLIFENDSLKFEENKENDNVKVNNNNNGQTFKAFFHINENLFLISNPNTLNNKNNFLELMENFSFLNYSLSSMLTLYKEKNLMQKRTENIEIKTEVFIIKIIFFFFFGNNFLIIE